MAEFLIYNKEHWMDALTSERIDEYKEQMADNYTKWRNAKIALTSEQISDILKSLIQKAKEDWLARHNEVLNMTEGDIDIAREKERMKFILKYDARNQMGDVVEVRPDGYWSGLKAPGYDKSVFLVVYVSGLSFKDAEHYGKPLYREETFMQVWMEKEQRFKPMSDRKVIRKCGHNFSNVTDKQSFSNISQVSITEKYA